MPARKKKAVESKSKERKTVRFEPDRVTVIRDRRIGLPGYGSTLVSVEAGGPIPEGASFEEVADAADKVVCGWLKPKVDEILEELEREEGSYGLG